MGSTMNSYNVTPWKLAVAKRPSASVVLVLAFLCQPVLSSTHFFTGTILGGIIQSLDPTPKAGTGMIVGLVVNERHEPVARVIVQAFSAGIPLPQTLRHDRSAETDTEGRFRISGLALGEYLIAAATQPLYPSGGPTPATIYGTTFYPSTIDARQAVRVSASDDAAKPIQVELVRVRGARVSGSVVSSSERPTGGMSVGLFHWFGGFGSGAGVGVVSADGTFEITRVPPGSYRLTIGTRPSESTDGGGEFAHTAIEVQDRDLGGISLVVGPGASISGRVVAEPTISTPLGLQVRASLMPEQFGASGLVAATLADDWSFRMTGLSGSYRFGVATDKTPFVGVTRTTLDGVETPAGAGVELANGTHELVVFVTPRESPKPTVDRTLSPGRLVEQFKAEKMFFRQFEIAEAIVARHDPSVLPSLVAWLSHEDRHVRGNVAFIFAGLGDPRGFKVITAILTDQSERPEGQGRVSGQYDVRRQIAADRYYAAHLLGDLRDPRAIPILVPLLKDKKVNSIAPWALGQIGDPRAIGPLINTLGDASPSLRVGAIYALETLHAREAVPRLTSLLNDHARTNFGVQISVADAAKAAIAKLQ
jgi:hypothetical protein